MATQAPGQPNRYELQHGSLHVTYALTDLAGQNQHFSYANHGQTHQFSGGQIQRTETPIGALVSVVIGPSVDADTTVFSLLVPNVNLAGQTSCPIVTFGVTTVRHTTLAGPRQGQMDQYTLSHELKGTASIVKT